MSRESGAIHQALANQRRNVIKRCHQSLFRNALTQHPLAEVDDPHVGLDRGHPAAQQQPVKHGDAHALDLALEISLKVGLLGPRTKARLVGDAEGSEEG